MQLQSRQYSLVIYNSDPPRDGKLSATEELEDYLSHSVQRNGKNVFITPWTFEELSSSEDHPPKSFTGCSLNGKTYYGQDDNGEPIKRRKVVKYGATDATIFIANEGRLLPEVSAGMAILQLTYPSLEHLEEKFKTIWEERWGIKPGDNTILVIARDTGTSSVSGVCPELDTKASFEELKSIIEELPPKGNDNLKAAPFYGVGFYPLAKFHETRREVRRDLEAYFLKWAYKNDYYKMAVGFQSGALDLLTFMGVPTVSIGLRKMIGEERHGLLAGKGFRRVNILYDQPRHVTTAFNKDPRHTPKEPLPPVIRSPFWEAGSLLQSPDDVIRKRGTLSKKEKQTLQAKTPHPFAQFDRVVVNFGLRIAVKAYIGWPSSIKTLKGSLPHVVDTHAARFCYLEGVDLSQHLSDQERLDRDDISKRRTKLSDVKNTLQEPDSVFAESMMASQNDWKKIYYRLGYEEYFDVEY
jgi:hypothetical protein